MARDRRPSPLPNRAVSTAGGPAAPPPRRQLPEGAARWSKVYLDHRDMPTESDTPVPVDENDRRTPHILHVCRTGKIEVDGQQYPCDQQEWLEPGQGKKFCPNHGCELTPDGKVKRPGVLPLAAMWRAVERSTRPAWVLAAEAAAGIGVQAGHVGPLWTTLAGLAAPAGYYTTRIYLTRRAIRRGKIDKGQREGRRVETIRRRARTAGYLGAAAGSWLPLASATDPHTIPGKLTWCLLPVMWAVGSQTWRRYVAADQVRSAPVVVQADPDSPVPELTEDQLAAAQAAKTWAEHVGFANTRALPGTYRRLPCGYQIVVQATKPGALSNKAGDNIKATVRAVAAGFGVPKAAITWIEEHDDDPNQALLLIQPNNPLKQGQVWAGPEAIDIERGVAHVGTLITGEPMLEVLYRYGWGAPSRLTLGTTGGGKSQRARLRMVAERWSYYVDRHTGERRGAFITMLHDPKQLESYAEFRHALPAYGITRDDAHIMLDALTREMFRRYDQLACSRWIDRKNRQREGGIAWDPRVHGPIISVFWDEFHALAGDKEIVAKLETLARFQRACGMTGELLSHMGTLSDTGSQALRDMLAGGRATIFRTTSALTTVLATGGQLTGDPRALPREPGMCYVADGETASLMGRMAWIPADDQAHEHTLYDYLFDDANNPIGYPAQIPPETVEAFGSEFMQWAAAGRQPGGRVSVVRNLTVGTQEMQAEQALRLILHHAGGPLSREQIRTHPQWRFGVTSTLTAVLRKGQDAKPPWLVKLPGNAVYDLTPAMRQSMAEQDEEEDQAA